jgi:hypothetical protein
MDDVDMGFGRPPGRSREPVCNDGGVETGTRRGREMWLWSCSGVRDKAHFMHTPYGKETAVVDTECLRKCRMGCA